MPRTGTTSVRVIKNEFPRIASMLPVSAEIATGRALNAIAEDARGRAPVRTGELRDSIAVEGSSVVANAEHAAYVEFGTRFMAAQPYLTPAFEAGRATLVRELTKLEGLLG